MQHPAPKGRGLRLVLIPALLIALVPLAATALSGCTRSGGSEVLVTVNGEPITKDDLYQ